MISRLATICLVVAAAIAPALAQWNDGWFRHPPRFATSEDLEQGSFTFCRLHYTSVRNEQLGHGWNTDYPDSDANFMVRLAQLTHAQVNLDRDGEPNHVVVRATDDLLFSCPFLFMSDVGTTGFEPREVDRLRDYLLAGGFLYVDDFWGNAAWEHWSGEIGKVLPPDEYPIVDIPLDHELFKALYDVPGVPQVPSIQHWMWSGGTTSERGWESATPHCRGIFDHDGRLMVVMTHNTDIADGWEREGESEEFFELFSLPKSYPMGINIVMYALTH
ncbi:MAG TPA: DUF4159 domain-containing protein [Thermoanaerobaculia bacterium]|nr:DUF4159 domain-containing protein [Thermoanaerobaculia bacterium]